MIGTGEGGGFQLSRAKVTFMIGTGKGEGGGFQFVVIPCGPCTLAL